MVEGTLSADVQFFFYSPLAFFACCYQHCTDEAQKAETVLFAVSYIYIYMYIFKHENVMNGCGGWRLVKREVRRL